MKFTWVLLVAATVCHVQAGRIIGGQPTTIEDYPSIVQVEFNILGFWGQSCAANILNSRYVVSAAHCFWGIFGILNINNRRIRAGSSIRNSGGTIVYATRRLNHPSYLTNIALGADADISLVELTSPLTFGSAVQVVGIPPQGFELPDGLPVVHAGWGDTVEGSTQGSNVLRDVTIFTVNRQLCADRYEDLGRGVVTENMICAGILDVGGKDACQGDSGGPLYFDGILVGIVSWGEGCANDTYPGISTRVSSYTTWLVENAV